MNEEQSSNHQTNHCCNKIQCVDMMNIYVYIYIHICVCVYENFIYHFYCNHLLFEILFQFFQQLQQPLITLINGFDILSAQLSMTSSYSFTNILGLSSSHQHNGSASPLTCFKRSYIFVYNSKCMYLTPLFYTDHYLHLANN